MPLEVIEPRRLYRQVADSLRQAIDAGDYPVGGRLPTERELADQLGVSRPTVREALIALEVEGRLRIRVGSGIYVIDPPVAEQKPAAPVPAAPIEGPFELLRARELVEGAVAAEAASVATADDVARLDAILDQMTLPSRSNDEMIAADRGFHTGVTAILDNAVLVRFVGELFDQRINPYFAQLSRYFETSDTWREALDEHRAIRDAIARRDPDGAREAMRRHLQRSQLRFSESFGPRPAGAAGEAADIGRRAGRSPSR